MNTLEFNNHCAKNYPKCRDCFYRKYCREWWKRQQEPGFDKVLEKKFPFIQGLIRKEKLAKLLEK